MAERRQKLRGTTTQLDQEIGLEGLLTYDTQLKELRVFDGIVLGGYRIPNYETLALLYTLPDRLKVTGKSLAGTSANTAQEPGFYFCDATTTDTPVADVATILVEVAGAVIVQTWSRDDNTMRYRRTYNGSWSAWVREIDQVYFDSFVTVFAKTILDDANAGAVLTTLGVSAYVQTLLDDADASTALSTLGVSAYAKTLLDDANASTALTTLGVSTYIKTLLDDADAATARATLGSNDAGNLTTGTLPDARLSGAYSGITTLSTSGLLTVTVSGEVLRLNGPNAADDPFISFYAGGTRQAYIQHTDGTGDTGFRMYNDIATGGDTQLVLRNTGGTNGLAYIHGATVTTVLTTGNYDALGVTPEARTITAGNGLTGGGDLSANRTLTLGTPSNITNSTTNSVTSTSHTHALGFTAAEVYTGSGVNDTSFPLGHILQVYSANTVNRNALITPSIRNDGINYQYVYSGHGASGTNCSGTWRSRGTDSDAWTIAQRVA